MQHELTRVLNTIILSPLDIQYHFSGDANTFISLRFYSTTELSIPSHSPIVACLREIGKWLTNGEMNIEDRLDEEVEKLLHIMFFDPSVDLSIEIQINQNTQDTERDGSQVVVSFSCETVGELKCHLKWDGSVWHLIRIEA